MRTKDDIRKDYFALLNKENNLRYSEEEMGRLLLLPKEQQALDQQLMDELYSTKKVDGQTVSTTRAFFLWCGVVIAYDFKDMNYIWNGFVEKQFELVEFNRMVCYMAARGHGKTFFLALYISFRMFLIPYFDVGYCTNTPMQRDRFFKSFRAIVDTNAYLLEKKDVQGVRAKDVPWGMKVIEYNNGSMEGITLGTTPRGGHYNLAVVDDPLREDKKYPYEKIVDYFQGVFRQTILRKKGRYIIVGCVRPDTKIVTECGIEEIGDQVDCDLNKKKLIPFVKKVFGKDGWDFTSNFFVNGKTRTKKIVLTGGYELECSRKHPLWTCLSYRRKIKDIVLKDCKWVKSSKLRIGDKVAIKTGTRSFGKIATISEDVAYFYGLFTAEGCVDVSGRCNRITISNQDKYCVNFLKAKFGFISQDKCHHRKNSKELVENMRVYGVSFEKCSNKRIPKRIMLEPANVQVAYLQGLYDGDGHSTISNNRLRVGLSSTSKEQLLDVQVMLLNFGIMTSLQESNNKGHYKKDGSYIKKSHVYSLISSGKSAFDFLQQIGFRIQYKNNKDLSMVNFKNNSKEHFGFVWRTVKSIEKSKSHTVDFVIPQSHSFLTNGIVSHNTPWDPEDPFHTLMNSKISPQGAPIGKIKVGQLSAAGFMTAIFPGILDDKKKTVLVPEIWTYAELMIEKSRIGEIRFHREILCKCTTYRNSLVSSSLFRSCCDENQSCRQQGETGKKYVIFADSATSDAPTADYAAFSVWEDDQVNDKFILRDLFHEKGYPITDPDGGTNDQGNQLFRMWKDFNKALMVIEKNNAGIALIQALQSIASKRNEEIDIIEHYTHTSATGRATQKAGKADDVIDYVEKGLKAGVVVFPSDPEDIYTFDIMEKVKQEHLNFGVKKGKSGEKYEALAGHDDIFDSCWGSFKHRGDMVDTIPFAITIPGRF